MILLGRSKLAEIGGIRWVRLTSELVVGGVAERPRRSAAVVMTPPDYAGYRFPSDVILSAAWMNLRYRDVENLLAERGFEVSYETIRRWVTAFGPMEA